MGDEGEDELSANLRDIVVHSPMSIAVFDREMRYVVHSKRYAAEYGLEHEDLVGRSHYEVFPELPARFREVHRRCLAGASESAQADPLVRQDGRTEWANWDVRPWRTATGDIGGIVVMTELITARIEMEAQLRLAHAQLMEAQRLARVGYWEWDLASQVVTWTEEVYRLFGIDPSRSPLTYDDYIAAVPEEARGLIDERVRTSIAAGSEIYLEHPIIRPDGTERHVAINGRVLRDDAGEPVRLVGAAQDITERHQLEEQLRESQKLETAGRLAGGVAHDFNNILTAIFSFSEFALETLDEDSPAASDIGEVLRAAEQAKSLTQQLLSFSRRRTVRPRVIQINERVRRVEAMIRRLLGEDIAYATYLSDDLWNTRIDPNALEQVIVNLAVNARDAMPSGGRMTIETANVTLHEEKVGAKGRAIPAGEYVAFVLSDSGHGMDASVLEHVFEPFYTTKPQGRGTGLGLSTCYGIIRQADGHLWAYSEPGHGSTFKIYLPRVIGAVDREAQVPAPMSSTGHESILLAEDNDQVRDLAVRSLEDLGYRVLACRSAEEALAAAREHNVDLLVTDVIMTGMNGKELASRVAELHPRIRVLYMSGYSENTIVHHGVLEDGVQLLQKPFNPSDLGRRVRAVLDAE